MDTNTRSKKELVKILIKNQRLLDNVSEDDLIDMLLDENIALDVDKDEEKNSSKPERVADWLTEKIGSWGFIIFFIIFLITWIILNLFFLNTDPYPFILLNLILSCVAALQAPIIMMSQNRQAKKDSLRSKQDYKTDLKSELILEEIHFQIDRLLDNQKRIEKHLNENNSQDK